MKTPSHQSESSVVVWFLLEGMNMKFTVWNVVGGIISLIFGGPIGLIIFFFLWLIVWYHLSIRGLLFIQSYLYLMMRADKIDPHEASIKANNLKAYESESLLEGAIDFSNQFTNGQQLPVIAKAKERGYIYRKKSFPELIKEVWKGT